jgi:xanthine dehydrogenase molybdopterin-binding subunit B
VKKTKAKTGSIDKIEGVVESHAQEHMYFEPQSTLAVPKHEQMEIDILCSTQGVNEVQVIIYSQT